MKCYATLPIDNMYVISQGIYQYLQTNSDVLTTTQYGWHFVDCKKLLSAVPELLNFFHQYNLIPRHAAVTVITNNNHLPKHIDELPVIAKINLPVINTQGWANRWYQDGQLVAELLDLDQPIVFNSQIEHSVEKLTATDMPRVVASFTFYNEPLDLLK
jgi:hypothetical protein